MKSLQGDVLVLQMNCANRNSSSIDLMGCAPRTSSRMGHCGRFTKRKVQARGGSLLIHVFLQETLGSQAVQGVEPISESPACTAEKALCPSSSSVP
jgi:hypothetical protein